MIRYLVISTMENGMHIQIMDKYALEKMLDEADEDGESYKFITEECLKENPYTESWSGLDNTSVLIVTIKDIIIPIQKTVAWRLPQ